MRILFIELEFHWDCLDGFCELMKDAGHEITILTTEKNHQSLSNRSYFRQYQWLTKPTKTSLTDCIATHLSLINSQEVLFVNTIHLCAYAYRNIRPKGIFILRVHNTHKQFAPFSHIHIPFQPRTLWKAFSYFVREMVWYRFPHYRKKINQQVDYFTFLYSSIKDYTLSQGLVAPEKVMFCMPLRPAPILPPIPKVENNSPLHFTMFGALDPKKKDLQPVVDALAFFAAKKTTFPRPVHLTLLGNGATGYGREIIAKIQALNIPNFHLHTYKEMVPNDEFYRVLGETHIMIGALRTHCITEIYDEIYGKTKYTGTLGELLKFQIPVIFPKDFSIEKGLQAFVPQYADGAELAAIMESFIVEPQKVPQISQEIRTYIQANYGKEMILKQWNDFIAKALAEKLSE